jgi:hypothetical protein
LGKFAPTPRFTRKTLPEEEKISSQNIWVDVDDIWLGFNNYVIKWWVQIRLMEFTIDSAILNRYEVSKVKI